MDRGQKKPVCPMDKSIISLDQIFEDKACQRQLQYFKISCTQHQVGCLWTGDFDTLQDHLESCLFLEETCKNKGCCMEIMRKDSENHRDQCPWGKIVCIHCEEIVKRKEQKVHEGVCLMFPVQCEKCNCEKLTRHEVTWHLENVCPHHEVSCPFASTGCQFKVERRKIDLHLKEKIGEHLLLACKKIEKLESWKAAAEKNLKVPYTTKLWIIDEITSKLEVNQQINSTPFYTGPQETGYKCFCFFKTRRYSKGDDSQLHISLFFCLHSGDFDAIMPWPFKQKVYLTLVSQTSVDDYTLTLKGTGVNNGAFNRPSYNLPNGGWGYPTFMSHEDLKSGFIKDDRIVIKIEVEPTEVPTEKFAE